MVLDLLEFVLLGRNRLHILHVGTCVLSKYLAMPEGQSLR